MKPWFFHGKPFTEAPAEAVGFIYKITFDLPTIAGGSKRCFYIGKKNFRTNTKKKLTQKELRERPAKSRQTVKRVVGESNWQEYFSSSKELKDLVKKLGPGHFHREVLHLAYSARALTYLEVKEQFAHNVLGRQDECLNKNILSRFFPGDCQ